MASVAPAEAPPQETMRGKQWRIPANADPFFRDGLDWEKWAELAKPPTSYDPPQFAPGYIPKWLCSCCNWWQQRSPLCVSPCVPCGVAPCVYRCCVKNVEYLSIAEPDEWMVKMLKTGTSPNCPDRYKGIFWLHDNIAAHEHLVTFHDADWATDKLALKSLTYNWTRGPTAFGAFLFCFVQMNGNTLRMEISPDGKWMSIGGSSGNPTWIYIPSSDEKFALPGGGELKLGTDELQRISYNNDADPSSGVAYQYRVRKIAYLDDAGKLVKTEAYGDLLEAATMPFKYKPCCCGYCFCLSDEQRAFSNFPQLPERTVIKFAPPPPGAP